MQLDDDNTLKQVFNDRVRKYVRGEGRENPQNSPIFEMLNTSVRFGLLNTILEMALGYTGIISKKRWSKIVWELAWRLDDLFWKSSIFLHGKNDILVNTIGKAQYLTWWDLADNAPHLQGICETMARLVCHASQLKCDDPRFKKLSFIQKVCHECELGIVESVYHLVMQCPATENSRLDMFWELKLIDPNFEERGRQAPGEMFYWIMGKRNAEIDSDKMIGIWTVAGYYVTVIYRLRLSLREGIG